MPDTSDDVVFAGCLLTFDGASVDVNVDQESFQFLQSITGSMNVISVHGPRDTGKTEIIRKIVNHGQEIQGEVPADDEEAVWLYVRRNNYAGAHYIAVLDRPGFGENEEFNTLLYKILSAVSSVVLHVVDGELTSEALDTFAFLHQEPNDDGKPPYVLPQKPKLIWLLQNSSTSQIKELAGGSNLSIQQAEQAYLETVLSSQAPDSPSALFCDQFVSVFPDQICFSLPPSDSDAMDKRVEKLEKIISENDRNQYAKQATMNGPLLTSLLVTMLAHTDDVFSVFRRRLWKEMVRNCCMNIVETGVKLYKTLMVERLGDAISNRLDLADNKYVLHEVSMANIDTTPIELPTDMEELDDAHDEARRVAKKCLKTLPVCAGKLNKLLRQLFQDLVQSAYKQIEDENNAQSSEVCRNVLTELHQTMREKVEAYLVLPDDAKDTYSCESSTFKRFYISYQMHLYELMADYTENAKGPMAKTELAQFTQNTIVPELSEMNEMLERVRENDMESIQDTVREYEDSYEDLINQQRQHHRLSIGSKSEKKKQLVHAAKLHQIRKEMLTEALKDLDYLHQSATEQGRYLEENAFNSVQASYEQVVEAQQEQGTTQLQGYLVKQGGGGSSFNPFSRNNWKERYFILIGSNLFYAKSKDEYERGRIIKEISLRGCHIEQARDAGEGINIIPPEMASSGYVFQQQRGFFEKNSKKRASAGDAGRVFHLRAKSVEERDMWMDKLRQSTGRYA